MTTEFCSINRAVNEAFVAVWLFTRSMDQAEAAVAEAIACDFVIERREEDLALKAIERAVSDLPVDSDKKAGDEDNSVPVDLPPELLSVWQMPDEWRHCFVLRVLVGASVGTCASILVRPIMDVKEGVCAAMVHLAKKRGALDRPMRETSKEISTSSSWRRYGKPGSRVSRDAQ